MSETAAPEASALLKPNAKPAGSYGTSKSIGDIKDKAALKEDPKFTEPIVEAWRRHVSKLEGWEKERFEAAAAEGDLSSYVVAIKMAAAARKDKSWLKHVPDWLEPIATATQLYMPAATVAIQAYPNPSSLILGGIICVMQVSENYHDFQEKLAYALQETATRLKILDGYSGIYRTDQDVQEALCDVYGAMLDFCSALLRLLQSKENSKIRRFKMFGTSLVTTFDKKYETYIRDFRRSLEIFEETAKRSERRRAEEERIKAEEARQVQKKSVADQQRSSHSVQQTTSKTYSEVMGMTDFAKQRYESDREEAKKIEDGKLRDSIIRWISPLPFDSDYSTRDLTRMNGTCQWILDRNEYKEWKMSRKSSLLWVKGKHGCGKSILASRTIKDIQELKDNNIGLAFVFCKKQQGSKDDPLTLVRSLLGQLVIRQTNTLDVTLQTSFSENSQLQSKGPVWQQTIKCLQSVVSGFKQVYIVFDGLDECKEYDAISKELLELSQTSVIPVKVLLLSRPNYDTIEHYFGSCTSIVMDEGPNDEDLKRFIQEKCSQQLIGLKNTKDIEFAQSSMFSKAERTFLYVDLKAGDLKKVSSPGQLKRVLNALPKGIHEIYQQALQKVEAEADEETKRYAFYTLLWTMYAKRPLSKLEMLEAISVVLDTSETLEDDLIQNDAPWAHLISDLIRVDESGHYQLVHSSVKDYCESIPVIGPSPADHFTFEKTQSDRFLAQVCLTYLLFDRFNELELRDTSSLFEKNPFLEYCSAFWGRHLSEETEATFNDMIGELMNNQSRRDLLVQCHAQKVYGEKRHAQSLHLAAIFDLITSVKLLKTAKKERVMIDGFGNTPFHYAFREKNEQICLWMLEIDKQRTEAAEDRQVQSSLSAALNAAVANGWPAVVEKLIGFGLNVNESNLSRETPLISAALGASKSTAEWNEDGSPKSISSYSPKTFTENHKIVKLLLGYGADPNASNYNNIAPIAFAVFAGDEILFQILLEADADMSGRKSDTEDQTLLHLAIRAESLGMARCTAQVVDIDARDYSGNTPLHTAASKDFLNGAQFLLAKGADPRLKNDVGRIPLHVASVSNSLKIVKCLLRTDPDSINLEAPESLNSLCLAAERSLFDMMSLLIEHGAYPQASNSKMNALFTAVVGGDRSCVKLALDQGLDVNQRFKFGYAPLTVAASLGYVDIVSLLIERGADANSLSDSESTALHGAAWNGHTEVTKLLLEVPSIDINRPDGNGSTPLFNAAMNGHVDILSLLVAKGANKECTVTSNLPVHWAAWNGHLDVVMFFEDQIQRRGFEYRTPLHDACLRGHLEVCQYLISQGVDLEAKDIRDKTPLTSALRCGFPAIGRALIEAGANVNNPGLLGRTPLLEAVDLGGLDLVQFIVNKGGDPLKASDYGDTPLSCAIQLRSDQVFRYFESLGYELQFKVNSLGISSLHDACVAGNLLLVDRFLNQNVDLQAQDISGRSALSAAGMAGHTFIFNRLLEAGALPDEYLLVIVTRQYQYDCLVKALLAGANVESTGEEDEQTSLISATYAGWTTIMDLLIKMGADIFKRDAYGFCAYDYAQSHPQTRMFFERFEVSYQPLAESERIGLLKKLIAESVAEILAINPHDARLRPGKRGNYVRILANALQFVGSSKALEACKFIWQDILCQSEFSQIVTCICNVCDTSLANKESWLCLQEMDMIMCNQCYLRHMKANPTENAIPQLVRVWEELEDGVREVALACWPLTKFGIAQIAVCFFMSPTFTSWLYQQLDRYKQWETVFNLGQNSEPLAHPGWEFIKQVQQTMVVFEDLPLGEPTAERDPRYSALDDQLDKLTLEYYPIRKPRVLSCAGHDFLHIQRVWEDKTATGEVFSDEWAVKPEYLQKLVKLLDDKDFYLESESGMEKPKGLLGSDILEGTKHSFPREPLPKPLEGEERQSYLKELDEQERTVHLWDRATNSIQTIVLPQDCLYEKKKEYLDYFLSEAAYKLAKIIKPEAAEELFAEIYKREVEGEGEQLSETPASETETLLDEQNENLRRESTNESKGSFPPSRRATQEIDATVERARNFAQSQRFVRK